MSQVQPLAKRDVHPQIKAAYITAPYYEKAQLAFSSNDVSEAFGKLDAPHPVLVTILSCALVVGR